MTLLITAIALSLLLIFMGGFELLGGTVVLCMIPIAAVVVWKSL